MQNELEKQAQIDEEMRAFGEAFGIDYTDEVLDDMYKYFKTEEDGCND